MLNHKPEAVSQRAEVDAVANVPGEGLYGVFNAIAEQHAEATRLLRRLESAHAVDDEHELWRELRAELLSHESAELEVYPIMFGLEELRDIAERHRADAQRLEAAVAQADAAEYGTETWKRSLRDLKETLRAHVEDEEQEYFQRATELVDKRAAEQLETRFLRAKESLMKALGDGS
jgi:hypothetical protein